MRFSKFTLVVLSAFILFGCAAGVSRKGYSVAAEGAPADCSVLVLGYIPLDNTKMEVVGRLSVYDTGLSLHCDEEYVLGLMQREACSVGADFVNITEEKYPDFWSTCYRAKADLVRLKNREDAAMLKTDPHYAADKVRERSQEGRRRIQEAISAGIMGGIIGGMSVPR